jgi:hypothetical protein
LSRPCSRMLPVSAAAASNAARALEAAEFVEQVASNAGQQVIGFERGLIRKLVHDRQRHFRALGHPDGDRAVEVDNGRAHHLGQLRIEPGNARPVGIGCRFRLGVAGDNRCLKRIEAGGSAQLFRAPQCQHPPPNLELVPERTVLIQKEDGVACRVDTCCLA